MRSAARGLVETRQERFESRYGLDDSRRRLDAALVKAGAGDSVRFDFTWAGQDGRAVLEAVFAPPRTTERLLKALSTGMALLVLASVWALVDPRAEGGASFLLPLITVLATLGFPFLVLGLASHREAAEARIRKAIRVALQDEEEKLPPQQRWPDED
ncbi:MAG TPA: hypothetical protein VEC19_16175 [Usitatibacter sp.]|nr:hypothetical protein [Usitatibacter sp.]